MVDKLNKIEYFYEIHLSATRFHEIYLWINGYENMCNVIQSRLSVYVLWKDTKKFFKVPLEWNNYVIFFFIFVYEKYVLHCSLGNISCFEEKTYQCYSCLKQKAPSKDRHSLQQFSLEWWHRLDFSKRSLTNSERENKTETAKKKTGNIKTDKLSNYRFHSP